MFFDTTLLLHLALLAATCSVLASGVSATIAAKSGKFTSLIADTGASAAKVIPGRYIIAVGGSSSTLSKRDSQVAISSVINKIGDTGVDVGTERLYQSPGLLTGASIVVPVNTTAAHLLAIPGVTHVWPVRRIPKPKTFSSSGSVSAGTSPASSELTRRHLLKRRANEFKKDQFPPHQMTGVDKMHAKGYLGAGIRIAIIDTGVDYYNPILGGCFSKGCKIAFGHGFIDNEGNSVNNPDPFGECIEHGTHVAGTIGANPNKYGFTGVAPRAILAMYRVYSCDGQTRDDIVIAAMLRASEDKADILSMSLGDPGSWLDATAAQHVAEKLLTKGMHVIVAAGNSQDEGLFSASTPVATRSGASIASVDATIVPGYNMVFKSGGLSPIPYFSAKPFETKAVLSLYFTSPDSDDEIAACKPLTKSANLKNRLVVLKRGSCLPTVMFNNVAAKGAAFALVYGDLGNEGQPYYETKGTPLVAAAGVSNADALKLLKAYRAQKAKGPKVTFPSNIKQLRIQQVFSGGEISKFSQFGPTNDICVINGTSMATPFVAGSVALILSARKKDKFTPVEMRQLLSSTAKSIPVKRGTTSPLMSTVLQGGGLIQVDKAVAAKSFFGPNELYLNDTTYFASMQTVTITNKNSKAVTYRYSDTGAQPRLTYDKKGQYNPSLEPPALKRGASVTFRPGRVTVPAGKTTTFQIKFQPPQFSAGQVALFPVYSGFIMITADNKESFQIPYFGLAGSMRDMQILDQTNSFSRFYDRGLKYPFLADSSFDPQTNPNYVKNYVMESGITIVFRLAQATRAYNIDLVLANTTFRPTISPGNNAGLLRRSADGAKLDFDLGLDLGRSSHLTPRRESQTYASVPIVGHIEGAINVHRDLAINGERGLPFTDKKFTFKGQYQTTVKSGKFATAKTKTPYRFLLRAVRTTADPADEASWESWLSPPFQFSGSAYVALSCLASFVSSSLYLLSDASIVMVLLGGSHLQGWRMRRQV
ncbi:BQ2448_5950 [Microbotryum intermedium]|uniref:BQ2448_5950 protein n=1 Tax=Microbotryum intermedium TaxID=269621 RepID=A0A238F630_9BASI|nr:BQ2448_5950 [Microbotryum intermedium]